jgi:hypothetical protein
MEINQFCQLLLSGIAFPPLVFRSVRTQTRVPEQVPDNPFKTALVRTGLIAYQ